MLFHVLGLGNVKSWTNKRSKTCNNNEMTPANISHKWFRLLCLLWIASAPPWLSSAADRTLTNSNAVVLPLKGCSPDDISDVMHLDLANPQSFLLIITILQNILSTITCNSKEPAGVAVCLLWKNLQIFSRQLRLQTKMTNMATPRRRLTALTATAMLEQTWPHIPWLLSSSLRGSKLHVRPKTRNSLA